MRSMKHKKRNNKKFRKNKKKYLGVKGGNGIIHLSQDEFINSFATNVDDLKHMISFHKKEEVNDIFNSEIVYGKKYLVFFHTTDDEIIYMAVFDENDDMIYDDYIEYYDLLKGPDSNYWYTIYKIQGDDKHQIQLKGGRKFITRKKHKKKRKTKKGGTKKRMGIKTSRRKSEKIQKSKHKKMPQKFLKKEKEKEMIKQMLLKEDVGKIGVPSIGNARKLYKKGHLITALATLSAALTTPQVGNEMGLDEVKPILPLQSNATNWAFPYQVGTDPRKKSITSKTRRMGRVINKTKKSRKK